MKTVPKLIIALFVVCASAGANVSDGADPAIKNVWFIISDDLRANALGCYGDRFCKSPNIDALAKRSLVAVQYDGDGSDQPDHKSATKAIELLQKHKDEPFFLAVGFVRPHYPMIAPREYFDLYHWEQMLLPAQQTDDLDDIPKQGQAKTISAKNPIGKYPDNQKRMWAAYDASITFMDHQVGRVIDELDRLGLSETTAVVFTSDHGYHLGDHGFWQKSTLHEQILRVPLIVMLPGHAQDPRQQDPRTKGPRQQGPLPRGRTEQIVELTDLYPTLSELAGLESPVEIQGESFVSTLEDPSTGVRDSALSVDSGCSLRTSDWHYIRYNPTTAELYDMKSDPGQFQNLFEDPQHRSVVAELDNRLNERLSHAKLQ